ncbi:MAG TPA: bifunctional oligoribonuclease/PAP phosphatase NrnA [Defluviitaleaceae bacterium]|jgi:phosphoesterase RecJ-like protein|nr:bifunctional oligoribonuclease/PAP phosphatase NrnA [Defluviitaleaceae bacterium]HPT75276.1 bifunctional oligoribonuclease/PAP phosphatase NrnA [Defluviitaleaceae bacterium]
MTSQEIYQLIHDSNYIAIAVHTNPDGDAIGACTALALVLKKIGKKPIILMREIPDKYNFLAYHEFICQEYPKHLPLELFIALDCGDKERIGEYSNHFDIADTTMNIDHHITNLEYADYNLVNSKASSTCEIIYKLIKDWEISLDQEISSALYTGIAFDTGGFKHNNTSSYTHLIVADLLAYNINFTDIMDKLFHTRSISATKLLGYSLNKMEFYQNNQLCLCTLDKKELESFGAKDGDTEGIISFLKNTEGVLIACLLYEKTENETKVSFRSSGDIDISYIAQKFGGGGHKKAAGCTINKNINEAKEEVINTILKELF